MYHGARWQNGQVSAPHTWPCSRAADGSERVEEERGHVLLGRGGRQPPTYTRRAGRVACCEGAAIMPGRRPEGRLATGTALDTGGEHARYLLSSGTHGNPTQIVKYRQRDSPVVQSCTGLARLALPRRSETVRR